MSNVDPSTTAIPAADNPYVSYGSCWINGDAEEAPTRYIPCGNANFGHVPCCESQDMCLSSNACYNAQFGITYLAGCTDETYKDNACPNKGAYNGDSWVGLSYCNGTSNEWVACEANRGSGTVTTAKSCWCPTSSRTVAFTDASRLANIVSLGTAKGESVAWQGGFLPVTTTKASSSSTGTSETTTTTETSQTETKPSTSSATSNPPIGEDSDGAVNSSNGAKIGIGVGVGVGALVLLAVLFALIRRYRRRRKLVNEPDEDPTPSARPVTLYNAEHKHEGDLASPCWSGHKSELDAIGTASSSSPRQSEFGSIKSEVEGSPAIGSAGRPMKDGGFEMPGKLGTVYEMPA